MEKVKFEVRPWNSLPVKSWSMLGTPIRLQFLALGRLLEHCELGQLILEPVKTGLEGRGTMRQQETIIYAY